jgi:hypothetical protein
MGDNAYYEHLADLFRLAGVTPERTVITNLCRASFVRVELEGTSAKEEILSENHELFSRYVLANIGWHSARLDEG